MANNRMQIYCKKCLEAKSIAKYYPCVWGTSNNIGEGLNDFFEEHQDKCYGNGDKMEQKYIGGGEEMFGFRTENDEDGYLTAFEPYRIFKDEC